MLFVRREDGVTEPATTQNDNACPNCIRQEWPALVSYPSNSMKTRHLFTAVACGLLSLASVRAQETQPTPAPQSQKPNIIVIWGDDIGVHNISAYNLGIMGYMTPNIDRIAKEGMMFTHAYAQQSCTAAAPRSFSGRTLSARGC